ncbi:MAG: hypothetical protein EKK46_16400, partial [Rhodocyclaceae bacterium]
MAVDTLLAPGRRLIEKLRFGQKFLLVGTIFLIPIAVLLSATYQKVSADIAFAEKERTGLNVVAPARRFLQTVQHHRGRAQLVFAGKADSAAALAEARKAAEDALDKLAIVDAANTATLNTSATLTASKSKWAEARDKATSGSAEESFTLHGAAADSVLDYIGLAADNSNLTLDPDVDSFYIQDALTQRLPRIAEMAGKLRAKSSLLATRKALTTEDRVELGILIASLGDLVQASAAGFDKATQANPDLKATLSEVSAKVTGRAEALKAKIQADLLNAKEIDVDPVSMFAQGSEVIEAAYGAFDAAHPALDALLAARAGRLRDELQRDLIISAATLLGALYLFLSLRSSVIGQIASIRRDAERISVADFDHPIVSSARDEISDISLALEKVRVNLKAQIEKDRRVADEMTRIKIALDNVSTGVMIADTSRTIIYTNRSVNRILKDAEADIRKALPNFSADRLVGSNIDQFHKNPAHQADLLSKFTSTYTAALEIGGRHMTVSANPVVNDQGQRLGAVAEWRDRTAEIMVEQEVERIVGAASTGDFSQRLTVEGKQGFFRSLAEGLNALLETSASGLQDVAGVLKCIAKGDLTQ